MCDLFAVANLVLRFAWSCH